MSDQNDYYHDVENEVIFNSRLEHLYNHEFGDGRFFYVVFSNQEETHIRLASRTLLKVVYIKEKNDVEGIEIIKSVSGSDKERVKFSKFNLQQLRCFLDFLNSIDLKGVSERRIGLADEILDDATKRKIETLLSGEDGGEFVGDLLANGLISSQDLVNTGYRKLQLEEFRKLLYEDYLSAYKKKIGKPNTKDETAWQDFFKSNEWIFGYGLDYRFQGILQKEFHASDTNAGGKECVISDYLLGDKRFTTFVEIKLPTTDLFGPSKNRSKAWALSNDLIDAYSQILEQKASGQIKIETTKELLDDYNNEIKRRSFDSKTILIIGSWNQIIEDPIGIKRMKEKTFELFRRDSRNVDIVTYDELYERAAFIVNNHSHNNKK